MPDQQDKFGRYALVLLVLGVLGRLPAITLPGHSPLIVYFDGSYIRAAQDILQFNFHDLGKRVPVYPLLVALCGLNPRVIWIAQSILGVAASLMIFAMAFRRTRHGLYSLLVGLVCGLSPQVLVYESSVMTEALTNFLLVASLWLIDRFDGDGESTIRYPLGLGLIVTLACLTRPLMICLLPPFVHQYWQPRWQWQWQYNWQRAAVKRTLAFALPTIILIFTWCGFNYLNSGFFTPSTYGGHNIMDQVDPYVGIAPERFAVLRDAWLQAKLRSKNFPNMNANPAFDDAVLEVERRTGKPQYQIWHEYQSVASYLIIHHPLLYLRRAEQGWMQFWGEPTLDEVDWPEISTVTLSEFLMTLDNFLVREFEAAFLVLALFAIPCALVHRKAFTKLEYLTFAIALWSSVFAALTDYGENRRFCVPFYMLIVYTLLTRGWVWITAASSRNFNAPSI